MTRPKPKGRASGVLTDKQIESFAMAAINWLCELPDRTSPEDWPDACLVTGDELYEYLKDRLGELIITKDSPRDQK